MLRMVVFDVGETLVDETRHWSEWADWLNVPRFTFLAVLGAVIASGKHHGEVFPLLSDFDYRRAVDERTRSGWSYQIRADDFYPDALPCLGMLNARGLRVGVVGNQPAECEASLRSMGCEIDLLGSSESWGVAKPSAEFFHRLINESAALPHEICYVGDHPENDIGPARSAGLKTIFLRRGPWALTHTDSIAARSADVQIDALSEMSEALLRLEREA